MVNSMRFRALDGLRGIAAFVVLLTHLVLTAPSFFLPPSFSTPMFWTNPLSIVHYSPLRLLIAGPASVLVFFVLSGFVLCISEYRAVAYLPYLVKRVFRILPPFLAAILLSTALYWLVEPHPVASASLWFRDMGWTQPPRGWYLASSLLMTGVPEVSTLDAPTWSLVYEARISLIFPLIPALLRRNFWSTLCGAVAIILLGWLAPIYQPIPYTLEQTLTYAGLFVIGAAMAMRADQLVTGIRSLSRWGIWVLWLMALALLAGPTNPRIYSLPSVVGAVLIIPLCLASPGAIAFLESTVPRWLGRVSYSLYLLHVPVLLTVVHLWGDQEPLLLLCAITGAISLVVAEISYRMIEAPTIAFGRKLASRLVSRNAITGGP
jgi:peptidoglycan/LPS O-acetylase OafA/YrhL